MHNPIHLAVIGMGGFAGQHHNAVLQLEEAGECKLICTCDPGMDGFAERRDALRFKERGVQSFLDYHDMLEACAGELDAVTIPTPVPLHAPMHEACVKHGLAVYLEKPPTLDYSELAAMLAVEEQATHATNVGFNYIIEPARQQMKERLAAGMYGPVQRVTVTGLWPRDTHYYSRASWAGRLIMDGRLVLDSCMGNAMAHFVHNGLFWAGTDTQSSWAEIDSVQAELYRANAIEGTDTVFVRAQTVSGPEVRIAMSHACIEQSPITERIICEQAVVTWHQAWAPERGNHWQVDVRWKDGHEENWQVDGATLEQNLHAYLQYLRDEANRPVTRLIDSKPFVLLNDLAYIATRQIIAVPKSHTNQRSNEATGSTLTGIQDIHAIVRCFADTGDFPSDQRLPWAAKGGSATPEALPALKDVVAEMVNR